MDSLEWSHTPEATGGRLDILSNEMIDTLFLMPFPSLRRFLDLFHLFSLKGKAFSAVRIESA